MEVWICDDDEASASLLRSLLTAQERLRVRIFSDPARLEEALTMTDELPQVLFLDIVFRQPLQETLSLAVAERIHRRYPQLPIVFETAFLEYAPEIFEAAPVYLLHKPFEPSKVEAALRAARERTAQDAADVLTVRRKGSVLRLPVSGIQYIESDRRKLLIHTLDATHALYGKLSGFLGRLPASFARCHQSYIVNLNMVQSVTAERVVLFSGKSLPVSRRRKQDFQTAVDLFMARLTFAGEF